MKCRTQMCVTHLTQAIKLKTKNHNNTQQNYGKQYDNVTNMHKIENVFLIFFLISGIFDWFFSAFLVESIQIECGFNVIFGEKEFLQFSLSITTWST